jgi:hypothetical protein
MKTNSTPRSILPMLESIACPRWSQQAAKGIIMIRWVLFQMAQAQVQIFCTLPVHSHRSSSFLRMISVSPSSHADEISGREWAWEDAATLWLLPARIIDLSENELPNAPAQTTRVHAMELDVANPCADKLFPNLAKNRKDRLLQIH